MTCHTCINKQYQAAPITSCTCAEWLLGAASNELLLSTHRMQVPGLIQPCVQFLADLMKQLVQIKSARAGKSAFYKCDACLMTIGEDGSVSHTSHYGGKALKRLLGHVDGPPQVIEALRTVYLQLSPVMQPCNCQCT
jgi:hypothetical protein